MQRFLVTGVNEEARSASISRRQNPGKQRAVSCGNNSSSNNHETVTLTNERTRGGPSFFDHLLFFGWSAQVEAGNEVYPRFSSSSSSSSSSHSSFFGGGGTENKAMTIIMAT